MTDLQAQYLLLYLGYAPGGADGIWGKNSAAACKRFQADYGISASGTLDGDTQKKLIQAVAGTAEKKKSGSFWDDIRYFGRTDPYIACSCGQCGGFPAEPKEKLMRLADAVRQAAGRPMVPTSTVRCAAHNKAVGGVYNSRHLLGQAMDFYIPGMTAAQILALVRQPEAAYCYAIDSRHVHMDVV
jgi:peptidoglycan hydrolase-like protein with peptidoglycan-binding domain